VVVVEEEETAGRCGVMSGEGSCCRSVSLAGLGRSLPENLKKSSPLSAASFVSFLSQFGDSRIAMGGEGGVWRPSSSARGYIRHPLRRDALCPKPRR
jgi:hypothetical protein